MSTWHRARTKGELLALTHHHDAILTEAPTESLAEALILTSGSAWATALLRPTYNHGTTVMLTGDIGLLHDLVTGPPFARWHADHGVASLSIRRDAADTLASALGVDPDQMEGWDTFITRTAPPPPRHPIVDLEPSDRDEMDRFLAEHSPRTDGRPWVRPGQRWVGARDAESALVAIGCCEVEHSGVPMLAGIATAKPHRGRGLGRDITAELTRGAIAEHGVSALEMYSDNDVARTLYRSLGYREVAAWLSGSPSR